MVTSKIVALSVGVGSRQAKDWGCCIAKARAVADTSPVEPAIASAVIQGRLSMPTMSDSNSLAHQSTVLKSIGIKRRGSLGYLSSKLNPSASDDRRGHLALRMGWCAQCTAPGLSLMRFDASQ